MGPLRLVQFPPTRGQNPYLSLLYEPLEEVGFEVLRDEQLTLRWLIRARRSVTFLHFHWRPDKYYAWSRPRPDAWAQSPRLQGVRSWLRAPLFAVRLAAARLLGYRIVWTIHEVYPPETRSRPPGAVSRRLDRLAQSLLARCCHLLIAHDRSTADRARVELGRAIEGVNLVPHGPYIGVYPAGRPRALVREELGIAQDAFVFLCFGKLRRDKAIDLLLAAFRSLPQRDVALVVAGLVEDDRSGRLVEEAAAADPRITPLLGLVPDEGVSELFEAADAAVLARSEVWTSGSLILALSLGLPVVAAKLPPYEELLGGEHAGWLFRPGDADSLRSALERAAADGGSATAKRAAALEQAQRLPSWSEIGERTASLLLAQLNGRARA